MGDHRHRPEASVSGRAAVGGTLAHAGVHGPLVLLAVLAFVLVAAGVVSVRAAHVRRNR
ncbi:hypothetical protein GCM10010278_83380 [Streptomyces melanogenes]|nr:hypothetical protein GCM10010278_83380 [Streptomyces melanogenes]